MLMQSPNACSTGYLFVSLTDGIPKQCVRCNRKKIDKRPNITAGGERFKKKKEAHYAEVR